MAAICIQSTTSKSRREIVSAPESTAKTAHPYVIKVGLDTKVWVPLVQGILGKKKKTLKPMLWTRLDPS